MIEYGRTAGEATGRLGSGGEGSRPIDLGSGAMDLVSDTVESISSMPPEQLLLIGVAILAGVIILRRG
jgi:hypothetical protein